MSSRSKSGSSILPRMTTDSRTCRQNPGNFSHISLHWLKRVLLMNFLGTTALYKLEMPGYFRGGLCIIGITSDKLEVN